MKRALLLLCLCFALLPVVAHAQTPDSINLALADLSQKVGQTVTLDTLDTYTFEEVLFPDASLGCPQPGLAYAQVQTRGVQYLLTYQAVVYDYRVSSDGGVVVLCNEDAVVPPCPPPDVAGYLPPRLTVGLQGKVGTGGVPNNVRELPGSSSKLLGEIPSEATFTILDGPTCSTLDKVVWWKVDYNGLVGWTAESKDGEYYLEPVVLPGTLVPTAPPLPTATPGASAQSIDSANAAQVALLSSPENVTGVYALSVDGKTLAVGNADGTITMIDVLTNTAGTPISADGMVVTAMQFGADIATFRWLLATGGQDGSIALWEVGLDNTLELQFTSPAQPGDAAITALALNTRSQLIAVGDAAGVITLFDTTGGELATLTAGDSPIVRLEFGTTSNALLSVDDTGVARVWGIPASAG